MYCTRCYTFMTDKTVDLTAVHLCHECKEDLKRKKEPVNAVTLQKTLDSFKAWIAQELQEVRQAVEGLYEEDEEDSEAEDDEEEIPGEKQ